MSQLWDVKGSLLYPRENRASINNLPGNVYHMGVDMHGNTYLAEVPNFTFPARLYGVDGGFIDRVSQYWNSSEARSLGVMLTGIKGTGKSVTAKRIATQTGLPVILVDRPWTHLASFLSLINQDVVIFLDEIEKMLDEIKEPDLVPFLGLLDGGLPQPARRMFLMTCNDLDVSEFLLNRPSRIRYVKEFVELGEEFTREIVKDILLEEDKIESVVKILGDVEDLSIDSVASFCREVNLFRNTSVQELRKDFNLKDKESYIVVNRYAILDNGDLGDEEFVAMPRLLTPSYDEIYDHDAPFNSIVGSTIYFDRKFYASILDHPAPGEVVVGVGDGLKITTQTKSNEEIAEFIEQHCKKYLYVYQKKSAGFKSASGRRLRRM